MKNGKIFVLGMALNLGMISNCVLADDSNQPRIEDHRVSSTTTIRPHIGHFLLSRIVSVEGGVEELKRRIDEEGDLKGFVKLGGALGRLGDLDLGNENRILPFTVKVNERDDLDVIVSLFSDVSETHDNGSVHNIDAIKYNYAKREDVGKKVSWNIIDFRTNMFFLEDRGSGRFNLFDNENTSFGIVLGGRIGNDVYELDTIDRSDRGIDESENPILNTGSSGVSVTEVRSEREINLGLTAMGETGLSFDTTFGKNRIYALGVYQWGYDEVENSREYIRDGHKGGFLGEVGFERNLRNGQQFRVFYTNDRREDKIQDSTTGETIDLQSAFNAEHMVNFELRF